jgi:hypothetical protein
MEVLGVIFSIIVAAVQGLKKIRPTWDGRPDPLVMMGSLDGHYIGSLQSFGPLFNGKLNFLVFFQALVAFHLEGGEVYEYIFAILAANESKALGGIKPLDGTNMTFF